MAPYQLDDNMRATIAVAIAELAPAYGFAPVLVQALSNRELADGQLVSAPGANGYRDYGPLQVNAGTLRAMGGEWALLDPHELVADPVLGVKCGLVVFRWRTFEALTAEGVRVPMREDRPGVPDYDAQAAILRALPRPQYRAVLYRALASYNGGDEAMRDWPNVDPGVLVYVGLVWGEYERLQKGADSGK